MSVEASVLERPARQEETPAPVVRILADPAMARIGGLAAAIAALATAVTTML